MISKLECLNKNVLLSKIRYTTNKFYVLIISLFMYNLKTKCDTILYNNRGLNEKCFHSIQCHKVSNAVCYNRNMKELNDDESLTPKFIFNLEQALKLPKNNYESINFLSNYLGKCLCKIGFTSINENSCLKTNMRRITCDDSQDCAIRDMNSYCSQSMRRCNCNASYYYDKVVNSCYANVNNLRISLFKFCL